MKSQNKLTAKAKASPWASRSNGPGDCRHSKLALEGYVHGKRSRGRPKRRWLDGIKEDMESLNMTIQEATRTAQDKTEQPGEGS